jgi:hypothetical protein
MAETIRIALALEKEGLPVEIHDPDELIQSIKTKVIVPAEEKLKELLK